MSLSDPALKRLVKVDQGQSRLSIDLPRSVLASSTAPQKPYISVVATIQLPAQASLNTFVIATTALVVHCLPNGMGTKAEAEAAFARDRYPPEKVPAPLSPRKTIIKSVSGSIRGTFDLLDLLHLEAVSGSIDVTVRPQAASSSDPVPAQFTAVAASGSIKVDFTGHGVYDVPRRDYLVTVGTQCGSISGQYLLGTRASFSSVSGSISTTLLPVSAADAWSELHTKTTSGSVRVHVLSSLYRKEKPLRLLRGKHSVNSGSLRLEYPSEWEGEIRGSTASGSINVHGDDVNVVVGTPSHFLARKGDGDGVIDFDSVSGSVGIWV
ncbi:MAG: hypothetical protein M1815_001375 [Lichina confinis]|nr:MAG: hypothetical protein M1815_001375 [Lichina confinis]